VARARRRPLLAVRSRLDALVRARPGAGRVRRAIADSIEYRGLAGTLRAGARALLAPVLNHRRVVSLGEGLFDRRFGVHTAGKIRSADLAIATPSARYASNYEPVPAPFVTETIAGLRIDHRDFTFVDFGCGKGKALLLASAFPFKKIIGVELARDLKDIAADNARRYRRRARRCHTIEVVHLDAAELPIPAGPVVCFFFDPFGEEIMSRIVRNLERSLQDDPRDLAIIYINPRLDHLFEGQAWLTRVRQKYWCSVYRSRSSGPPPDARPTLTRDSRPRPWTGRS
jgi:SAM-dependent methyltransferase